MADTVNVGSAPNNNTGDLLRTAFQRVNSRFDLERAESLSRDTLETAQRVARDLEIEGQVASVAASFNIRTWATGQSYSPGTIGSLTDRRDVVLVSGVWYVAAVAHTAGATFAADLSAGKWLTTDPVQLRGDLATTGAGKGGDMVSFVHRYAAAATVRSLTEKARDHINAADAGILPNGTDHTLKMQALVDELSAAGGGVIKINAAATEYVMSWVMKEGVFVYGEGQAFAMNFTGTRYNTKIKQPAAGGTVIGWQPAVSGSDPMSTQMETNCNTGVAHLTILGRDNPALAGKGVHVQAATGAVIHDIAIYGFADEGFYNAANSRIMHASQILVNGCVLNRSRAANTYAFHVDGGDHVVNDIQAGPGLHFRSSANRYVRGIGIIGDNCRWDNLIGEFADVAITIAGLYHHGGRARGEFSYCENFEITAGGSSLGFLDSNAASMHQTGLYDGIRLTSASGNNSIVGWDHKNTWSGVPIWGDQIAPGTAARYGLRDEVVSDNNKNNIGPGQTTGNSLGPLYVSSSGSQFVQSSADPVALTVNSTTPAISPLRKSFKTANTSATTITSLPGGMPGQEVEIVAGDDLTTIQHNGALGGFFLPENKNIKLEANRVYQFKNVAGYYFFIGYLEVPPGLQFVGDADLTLAATGSKTVVYASPITANRTVTLPTAGIKVGQKWHISRLAGSTGAYVVNFGVGGTFPAATWGEVTFDGTNWYVTKKGTL